MNKGFKRVTMALILAVILALGISSAAFADNFDENCGNLENIDRNGPAPNMGDGVPDGPGW
jgi:hypothetical protein